MFTVNEVAEQLRVSRSVVYALIDAGKLVSHRIGLGRGTIRVAEEDLAAYLDACKVQQPQVRNQRLRHIQM